MTKRNRDAEKALSQRPKKRMAFTAPKNAATKAIIKRNAESSPLLRLPAEIRRKIFIEVLGDRLIHVKSLHDWDYSYKSSPIPPQDTDRPCERWCLLVCDSQAAQAPDDDLFEEWSNRGSSDDEDDEGFYDWSDADIEQDSEEESDTEGSYSEDNVASTPYPSGHGGDSTLNWQDDTREEQYLAGPRTEHQLSEPGSGGECADDGGKDMRRGISASGMENDTSPICGTHHGKIYRPEEIRIEQILIGPQPQLESNDAWRLLKEDLVRERASPSCPFGPKPDSDAEMYDREIHLPLLRTCRQVYTEANQVLWETNIFSFNDAPSFTRFMGSTSAFQKRSVRRMRLAMEWDSCDTGASRTEPWNTALSLPLIRSLQGLRELWLTINHLVRKSDYEALKKGGDLIQLGGPNLVGIQKLAILRLTQVHVNISHKKYSSIMCYSRRPEIVSWNDDQRDTYAALLRARLLNSDGAQ